MNKIMDLFYTFVFFCVFTYCFSAIKHFEFNLKKMLKRSPSSELINPSIVYPHIMASADKSGFSNICKNSSELHLKDYCIATYGNKKQAVFVENVCVESPIMVKGIDKRKHNPVSVNGGTKFIVVYNASSNFTKQFHYMDVIFTTLQLPPWNTYSKRCHAIFMPKVRKLFENLHHFLNDFAIGVYSLLIKFNFLFHSVLR